MTDMSWQDDQSDNQPKMATVPRKVLRNLEKDAAKGREAAAKLEQFERLSAFTAAGVAMDHPAAGYFVRGYSGEATPEAIRAEWEKVAGPAPQQGQQSESPTIGEELAAMQAGQNVANGTGDISQDKMAERDAKLAALSPTDPRFPEKFDAIAREYGTVYGNMV